MHKCQHQQFLHYQTLICWMHRVNNVIYMKMKHCILLWIEYAIFVMKCFPMNVQICVLIAGQIVFEIHNSRNVCYYFVRQELQGITNQRIFYYFKKRLITTSSPSILIKTHIYKIKYFYHIVLTPKLFKMVSLLRNINSIKIKF